MLRYTKMLVHNSGKIKLELMCHCLIVYLLFKGEGETIMSNFL